MNQEEKIESCIDYFFNSEKTNPESPGNFFAMVFNNLQVAEETIRRLKEWKNISLAIVHEDNGVVAIYMYDDTDNVLVCDLKRTLDETNGLVDFLENHPTHLPFIITYFTQESDGKWYTDFPNDQLYLNVPNYFYCKKRSDFHYQSSRNLN